MGSTKERTSVVIGGPVILYWTSFDDLNPALKASNVDHASMQTITCPFLPGLTLDSQRPGP